MSSQRVSLGFTLLCILFASGCGANSYGSGLHGGLRGRLTITGSSTLAPLVSEAAKRFESEHPQVRIDVQTGGSGRGIRDTIRGVADIGMSSRPLDPTELRDLEYQTVAWDGVAFVIHQENPIEQLTKSQLRAIYSGEVTNWSEFGGKDSRIVVSSRAAGRSELKLMMEYLGLKESEIQASLIDGETQQSIKTVTTNRGAITYTSLGSAQHAADLGSPIKLLPLEQVAATAAKVQSGEFPLARPLILMRHREADSAIANEFMSYLASPAIDDLTESLGYVPPQRSE